MKNNNELIYNHIEKARTALIELGWSYEENFDAGGLCHLILTKDDSRRGWGMFDQFYCWSEAYTSITGNSWLELTP